MDTVVSTMNKILHIINSVTKPCLFMKNLIKAYSNRIGDINSHKRRHLIRVLNHLKRITLLVIFFKKPRPMKLDVKLLIVYGRVNVFPTEHFIFVLWTFFFILNTYSFKISCTKILFSRGYTSVTCNYWWKEKKKKIYVLNEAWKVWTSIW